MIYKRCDNAKSVTVVDNLRGCDDRFKAGANA